MRHRKHVAAGQQLANAAQAVAALLDDLLEEARAQPERGDAVPLDRVAEFGQGRRLGREQHETRAVQQRAPDLEGRGVEGHRRELQEHLVRAEARIVGVAHEAHYAAMWHAHALGAPGRAGCEAHVGERLRADGDIRRARAVRRGDGGELGPVKTQEGRRGLRQAALQRGGGQHHRRARVLEHEGQARPRVGRVERGIRAARFQDAEQGDQHLRRTLQAKSHQIARAHAERAQMVRELVGPAIELAVLERESVAINRRHRRRRARGLLREQGVDRGVLRIIRRGGVPLVEDLPALRIV